MHQSQIHLHSGTHCAAVKLEAADKDKFIWKLYDCVWCTSIHVCLIFEPVIWLSCSKTASLHCDGLSMCAHSNRKGLSMINLNEPSSCVSGIYSPSRHTILVKFGFLFLTEMIWKSQTYLQSFQFCTFNSVIINPANKSLDLVTETNQLVFHVKMSCCGWERKQWILFISVQFYLDSTSQQQSPRGTFNS